MFLFQVFNKKTCSLTNQLIKLDIFLKNSRLCNFLAMLKVLSQRLIIGMVVKSCVKNSPLYSVWIFFLTVPFCNMQTFYVERQTKEREGRGKILVRRTFKRIIPLGMMQKCVTFNVCFLEAKNKLKIMSGLEKHRNEIDWSHPWKSKMYFDSFSALC